MKMLDQENVQNAFVGYYHDDNFNEDMEKEKSKIHDHPVQQTRNSNTVNLNGDNNRHDSMDSNSQADQQSKLSNYRGQAALLVSSTTNNCNLSNVNSTSGTKILNK